jgi:hypothetical protein
MKGNEVTRRSRKLHIDEVHNLYSSQSKIRILKSRKIRWAVYVTGIGRRVMRIGYW